MRPVDLHVHSNKSDGSMSPAELVELAAQKGLRAFALTDHDTIDGLSEAMAAAAAYPELEVIPGIELSSEYHGKDIHIVGLYLDYHNEDFLAQLHDFQHSRVVRNEKMCNNLREAGIDITFEKLQAEYPDSVITRAHYARYLLSHGYVQSLPEAFDRYVGDHTRYFVPREKITPMQAVKLIRKADGIPILAHPTLYHMSDAHLEELIVLLKDAGLTGMECIYSTFTPAEERAMKRLADRHGLLYSGGSDFHGKAKPNLELGTGYGHLFVPETILDELLKCIKNS
ncbi:MAG: PHP domain-containing protein [Lachnospiraceae bacterium]|nr:PHP domain-containing protein [Lachnospiraceae bacterium]